MRIAVTGSIATDHLMRFPGRFAEQLLADQLDRISLSFLVDDLVIRRGGAAANICYGLGRLGLRPVLVGAVGEDFADYRSWLDRNGVDTDSVYVSEIAHTARFVCTTDDDLCQIASFYPGAMSDARLIELRPIAERLGGLDLVVVSPNDPDAMLRHTDECRERSIPFAADPSQQLAWMDGPQIRRLVDGAAWLLCNDYEKGLLESKTGWSDAQVLQRVGARITTHGADGVAIEVAGEAPIRVPVVPARVTPDPTGVGDAFRAGFFAGRAWELSLERSAQLGCLLATLALETVGTQEYETTPNDELVKRLSETYGADAVAQIAPHLPTG
ncbi:carbohydrate kinase family protein [Candidatus Protofrankia californiensis]|uniref:carbohydrate kinase family protein n=1 Tax=Candidatus Protofrankia californiensis TaxID=1839754 RepID=UPI001041AFFF|nr:carbohydrate kinase family protein [Candidatus Protofrankia californiensis]